MARPDAGEDRGRRAEDRGEGSDLPGRLRPELEDADLGRGGHGEEREGKPPPRCCSCRGLRGRSRSREVGARGKTASSSSVAARDGDDRPGQKRAPRRGEGLECGERIGDDDQTACRLGSKGSVRQDRSARAAFEGLVEERVAIGPGSAKSDEEVAFLDAPRVVDDPAGGLGSLGRQLPANDGRDLADGEHPTSTSPARSFRSLPTRTGVHSLRVPRTRRTRGTRT